MCKHSTRPQAFFWKANLLYYLWLFVDYFLTFLTILYTTWTIVSLFSELFDYLRTIVWQFVYYVYTPRTICWLFVVFRNLATTIVIRATCKTASDCRLRHLTYIYIYTCFNTCISMYIYIYIYINQIHMPIYVWMSEHARIWANMSEHIYKYVYI